MFRKSERRKSMSKKSESAQLSPKIEKTNFQRYLADSEVEHRKYYWQKEQSKNPDVIEIENDLSPSLYEFFLMKLC